MLSGFPEYQAGFGIDWLEWGAAAIWSHDAFERIQSQLQYAKQHCQETDSPEKRIRLNANEAVFVQRTGVKRGGNKGEHFEYVVVYQGISIGLSARPDTQKGSAKFFVVLRGRDCLLHGAHQAYEKVRALLLRLGSHAIEEEKISRVDLRLDIAGLDIREFKPLIERRCFVSRVKQLHAWENRVDDAWTGFHAGKRPLRLNVYDKLADQRKKFDAEIFQALIDRCWGGVEPKQATRFEFQLGRSFLKKFGINEYVDLQTKLGSLLNHLTTVFIRFTAEPIDSARKHQSRATVHPLWAAVAAAFIEGAKSPVGTLVPIRRQKVNPHRLIRQTIGCLVSAALQKGIVFHTFGDFMKQAVAMIASQFTKDEQRVSFLKKYWQRWNDKPHDYPNAI